MTGEKARLIGAIAAILNCELVEIRELDLLRKDQLKRLLELIRKAAK